MAKRTALVYGAASPREHKPFRKDCKDCGTPITFYKLLEPRPGSSGWMPFTGTPVVLSTRGGGPLGFEVWELDLDDSHWKDCRNPGRFRAPKQGALL